jgi:hypothetical protein
MKTAALCRRFFLNIEENFYFFAQIALFFNAKYGIMLNGRERLCPWLYNLRFAFGGISYAKDVPRVRDRLRRDRPQPHQGFIGTPDDRAGRRL